MNVSSWPQAVRRGLAVVLLLAGAPAQPALAAGADAVGASAYYEDALVRFRDDDYRGAIVQLKNALQADPDHLPARILLGRSYLRLGAGTAAQVELRAARARGADENLVLVPLARAYLLEKQFERLFDEVHPEARPLDVEAELHLVLGEAHLELGALGEAERAFQEASVLRPADAAPVLGRAVAALRRGEPERAEAFADRALELAPDSAEAWYVKGEVRRQRRDSRGAVRYYDEALRRASGHVAARTSRAGALIDLGDDAAAKEDLDFVLDAVPDEPKATYLRALLLARAGDVAGARRVLESAARTLDELDQEYLLKHGPSLLLAGVVRYAQRRFNEAYPYLNRYVATFPHHAGARKLLGDLLLRRGEARRAVAVLEPARRMAPDDAGLLVLLGTAHMRIGEHAKATAAFEEAAARAPDALAIRTQLALNRLGAGEPEAAVAELETVLAEHPGRARAGLVLALLHLERGDLEAAQRAADTVVAEHPRSAVAHNVAGTVYALRGEWPTARERFEQAVSLAPGNVSAHLNLARLDERDGHPELAEQRYRTVLESRPGDARVLLELARLARMEGRLGVAIDWLEKLRATDPEAITAQIELVELYLETDEPADALAVAEGLETRAPESLPVLEAVGRSQIAGGKRSEASGTFRRMSRYAVYSAPWLHRVAGYQQELGDTENARWSLRKAVAASPDYLPAHAALAELDLHDGRIDAALERAATMRELAPDAGAGDALAGDIHMRTGRPDQALRAYEAAWKKAPSAALAVRLYRAREALGRGTAGVALLERWLAEHDDADDVRRVLAAAYARQGREEESADHYERLLRDTPSDPLVMNNLAALYQVSGDPRALELAERAYRLAPRHPAVADTLGWILVQRGETQRGLEYLREAHSRASREPAVGFHLAVALSRLGRRVEARGYLEDALSGGDEFEGREAARALLDELSDD